LQWQTNFACYEESTSSPVRSLFYFVWLTAYHMLTGQNSQYSVSGVKVQYAEVKVHSGGSLSS